MTETFEQQRQRQALRRQAICRLVDDVRRMMDMPEATATWTRSQADLVEMVHLAWLTRQICDPYGRPCKQQWLARQVFRAVGRPMPRNLTKVMHDVKHRADDSRSVLRAYYG